MRVVVTTLLALVACSGTAMRDKGGDDAPAGPAAPGRSAGDPGPKVPAGQAAPEGAELIGTPAPEWTVSRWFQSPPLSLGDLAGKVVLVRWFTSDDCPYCSATAPSLNLLHRKYGERGLAVIGMYHHKGKGAPDPDDVGATVEQYGFSFPVAIDADWKTLRRYWLGSKRTFTSVSFLLDREGRIRYIHPGGAYAPESPDFARLTEEIETLLATPP